MKRLGTFLLATLLALPLIGCEPNDTGAGGSGTTPSTTPSTTPDTGTTGTDAGAPGGADTGSGGATP
jgi:hypothetical protein